MRKLAHLSFALLFCLNVCISTAFAQVSNAPVTENGEQSCHRIAKTSKNIGTSIVSVETADDCHSPESCNCQDCPACHAHQPLFVLSASIRAAYASPVIRLLLDSQFYNGITLSLLKEPPIL